jgi:hypothetical protein
VRDDVLKEETFEKKRQEALLWSETLKLKKIRIFFFGPFCDREDNIKKGEEESLSLVGGKEEEKRRASLRFRERARSLFLVFACACVKKEPRHAREGLG